MRCVACLLLVANIICISLGSAPVCDSSECSARPSSAAGQTLIVDFDGTIAGPPGYKKEPTLGESPALQPLLEWLKAGGSIVVLSGCEAQRLLHRCGSFFAAEASKSSAIRSALTEGRVWMSANGGGVVYRYRASADAWVEDPRYRAEAIAPRVISIPQAELSALVDKGAAFINAFKAEHATNQTLRSIVQARWPNLGSILDAHQHDYTPAELLTLDSDIVPRIEVRRVSGGGSSGGAHDDVTQLSVIGVPTDDSVAFPVSLLHVASVGRFQVVKVGMSHEVNIEGVDKCLPLEWIKRHPAEYPPIDLQRSVAIGDNPDFNDMPMTHIGAFAFISVDRLDKHTELRCVREGKCKVSVRVRGLEHGTAFFVGGLLDKLRREPNAPAIPNAVMEAAASAMQQVDKKEKSHNSTN